jgi:elongation factor 1-alpha
MSEAENSTLSQLEKIESAKFAVLGKADVGKSSLIGVLTKNVLDNGNGYARSLIVKLKHEKETNRTSSHAPHYIVKNGEITTLIDLCGQENYLKTTIFGITGLFVDYGIMIVGANMDDKSMDKSDMTREHMGLLISNKIPFFVIITKIDICPEHVLIETKKRLMRIANSNRKNIIFFEQKEELVNGSYLKEGHQSIINSFQDRQTNIMPVIMVSNKTGHNIEFLKELLTKTRSKHYLERKNIIPKSIIPQTAKYPLIFYVDSTFSVTGIGIVLSGTVKYDSIRLGQKLFVGPVNSTYIGLTVKSIKNCVSDSVEILHENESGSIGIRLDSKGSYTRDMFNKGQIVTTDVSFAMKNTCYSFNADVAIFNHPTTIKNGYQTVIHCGTIRQTGKFIMDENKILRTNSRENVKVKFMRRPEFILPGTFFMFRDGHTKGMGRVNTCIPFMEDTPEPLFRIKKSHKRSEKKSKSIVKSVR